MIDSSLMRHTHISEWVKLDGTVLFANMCYLVSLLLLFNCCDFICVILKHGLILAVKQLINFKISRLSCLLVYILAEPRSPFNFIDILYISIIHKKFRNKVILYFTCVGIKHCFIPTFIYQQVFNECAPCKKKEHKKA